MECDTFTDSKRWQFGSKCRRCALYSSLGNTLIWYLRRLQADMSPVSVEGCAYRSRVVKVVDMIVNELQDLEEHPGDNLTENRDSYSDEKTDACSSCNAECSKCTTLDYAIRTNDVELVNVLLGNKWIDMNGGLPSTMLQDDIAMTERILFNTADTRASCCGRRSFVMMLLRRGVDIAHILGQSGQSVVKWVVEKGNQTLLRAAIECGSIHVMGQCNDKGDGVLHLAVRTENVAICRVLLEYKASILQQNIDGETPLGLALMSPTGHEIARLFLQEGDTICNATRSFVPELDINLPYLHIACYTGKLEIVKLILSSKSCDSLDQRSIYCKRPYRPTPEGQLTMACIPAGQFTGDCIHNTTLDIPRDLAKPKSLNISLLANINYCCKEGFVPLQIAVIGGKISVVEYLLSVGADACVANEKGTLFHSAVRSQNIQLMTYIAGLVPKHYMDCKDKTGSTPLHLSAKGANPAMCALLLEKGASLNDKDKNCETPLSVACFFGREETAQLLIQHGADITIADCEGTAPAYWALMNDKVRITKYLFRAGLKITPASFRRLYPRRMRIMQNEQFRHMLDDHMFGVPSLMDLSRLAIRERLCKSAAGATIKPFIDTLDIPLILKDFLLLRC